MSQQMISRKYEPPGRGLVKFMFTLVFVALGSAVYLAVVHYFNLSGMPDYEAIYGNHWSTSFGIPVSALAVPVYGVMLAMLTLIGRNMPQILQWVAWRVLLVTGFISGMAAVWFLLLLSFASEGWCFLCLASQVSALILSMIIWFRGPNRLRRTNPSRSDPVKIHRGVILRLGTTGVACVGLMMIGQFWALHLSASIGDSTAYASGSAPSTGTGSGNGLMGNYTGPAGISSDDTEGGGSITHSRNMKLPSELRVETNDPNTKAGGIDAPYKMLQELALPEKVTTTHKKLADSAADSMLQEQKRATLVKKPDLREILAEVAREDGIRIMRYMGGRVHITVNEHPLIGKPDAQHIIAFFVDYTLPECRERYQYLEKARKRYGDQIALLPLFAPMNPDCNKFVKEMPSMEQTRACDFAKLALAVWLAKPEQFPQFHGWLLRPGDPVPVNVASRYASQLVRRDKLIEALKDPRIEIRIKRDTTLYHDSGEGYMPKIMFAATKFSQAWNKFHFQSDHPQQELFSDMEKRLGVMPLASR